MGRTSKSLGGGIGHGTQAKKKRSTHDDFLEENWDCPVCTFKNPRNLYKCKICDAPRGSSTRKSRITEQIIQKQQQTQLMAKYGDASSSVLEAIGSKNRSEEVRRKSLADQNLLVDEESENSQTESESDNDTRKKKHKSDDESTNSDQPSSSKTLKMMPKSKKVKLAKQNDDSSDGELTRRKKTLTPARSSKKSRKPKSDTESDEFDNESDEPEIKQPPKKKTKQPLKEVKQIEAEKTRRETKAKHIPQKGFPKHRNIDKTTGVEHAVLYEGKTVTITEFKIRPSKPKPKMYPEMDEGNLKVNGFTPSQELEADTEVKAIEADCIPNSGNNNSNTNISSVSAADIPSTAEVAPDVREEPISKKVDQINPSQDEIVDTNEEADKLSNLMPPEFAEEVTAAKETVSGFKETIALMKESHSIESTKSKSETLSNEPSKSKKENITSDIVKSKKDAPKELTQLQSTDREEALTNSYVVENKKNLFPSIPQFHDKPSSQMESFGEQFKNAFKNTNPKNPSKKGGTEMTKQIETKNNISQSLKKSLNLNEEKPEEKDLDLSRQNQNENSNNSDAPSKLFPRHNSNPNPINPSQPSPRIPVQPNTQVNSNTPRLTQQKPRQGAQLLGKGTLIGNKVRVTKIGGPVTIRKTSPTGPINRPIPNPSMSVHNPIPPRVAGAPIQQVQNKMKPNMPGSQMHPSSFKSNSRQPMPREPVSQPHPIGNVSAPSREMSQPPREKSFSREKPRSQPTTPDNKKIGRNPVGIPRESKPISVGSSNSSFRPSPLQKPRVAYPNQSPISSGVHPTQSVSSSSSNLSNSQNMQGPPRHHGPKHSPQHSPINNRSSIGRRENRPPGIHQPSLGRPPPRSQTPIMSPRGSSPTVRGPSPAGHGPRQVPPRPQGPPRPMQPRQQKPVPRPIGHRPPRPQPSKPIDGMKPIMGIQIGPPVSVWLKNGPSPTPPKQLQQSQLNPPSQPHQRNLFQEPAHSPEKVTNTSLSASEAKVESRSFTSTPIKSSSPPPQAVLAVSENNEDDDDSDDEKSLQIDESGSSITA